MLVFDTLRSKGTKLKATTLYLNCQKSFRILDCKIIRENARFVKSWFRDSSTDSNSASTKGKLQNDLGNAVKERRFKEATIIQNDINNITNLENWNNFGSNSWFTGESAVCSTCELATTRYSLGKKRVRG